MGTDIDGTKWVTLAYTVFIEVMADNEQDAMYFGDLALNERTGANPDEFIVEIVAGRTLRG